MAVNAMKLKIHHISSEYRIIPLFYLKLEHFKREGCCLQKWHEKTFLMRRFT